MYFKRANTRKKGTTPTLKITYVTNQNTRFMAILNTKKKAHTNVAATNPAHTIRVSLKSSSLVIRKRESTRRSEILHP